MLPEVTFRPYLSTDEHTCLNMFDANCPQYFAPNERDDYVRFLSVCPDNYEVCEVSGKVVGAAGLFDGEAGAKVLNWILLDPVSQGQGVGSIIMARVSTSALDERANAIHIATSHKAVSFFEKFGAVIVSVTEHGWGLDMHRVDMVISL